MTSEESWTMQAAPPPGRDAQAHMLDAIARLVRRGGAALDRDAAGILSQALADPALLQGLSLEGATACYRRHLLAGDADHCVMAIVWQPGQMSCVHSHRVWCALGVQRGMLTETQFDCAATGLRQGGCRHLAPGAISHGPANEGQAHRVANLGIGPAVSVHVYGVGFDRISDGLNQVRAD